MCKIKARDIISIFVIRKGEGMNFKRVFMFMLGIVAVTGFTGSAFSQEAQVSTLEDQKNVEVTVYNSNIALIKDTRELKLATTEAGELRFMDVAQYIDPVTVHVESVNMPDSFAVLEQNYEYDLMNASKLLDKYVGKEITLLDRNPYQGTETKVTATLLSNNNGQIYKVGDEIYLGHPGYQILPKIPENLIAKPTLTWLFANDSTSAHQLKVSYLTSNMTWKADYVLTVDDADKNGALNGWVTVDNKSGTEYTNAQLKLVAGEVNRARDEGRVLYDMEMSGSAMMAKSAEQFVEQSFFEYHIYDLQRRTTLKNNQTKQVSLLNKSGIPLTKKFIVQGNQNYFYNSYMGQNNIKVPVEVFIEFKNSKENSLGMPLPAGVIRLYKADSKGSLQFIGEDRIDHTPKDELLRLKVGKAFDIVAERKQMDYQNLGSYVTESEWEIKIRNHKEEDIVVTVLEPVHGEWRIMKSSHTYNKESAHGVSFEVPVAKDGEAVLTYRVRVSYR